MNNPLNDKTQMDIEKLLKSIRPKPSGRFYLSMQNAPWNEASSSPSTLRDLKIALTAISIIALISLLVFTPAGQAIADGIAKFFTIIEEKSFEVPEEMIISVTQHAPSNPLDHESQTESRALSDYIEDINRVESRIGFDLKQFAHIPTGFNYFQIAESGEDGIISIIYRSNYGYLVLQQGIGEFPNPVSGLFDQVPAGEVQSVDVNNYSGEYVHGYFLVYAGETVATWISDPSIQRLRWREGDRWFELQLSINTGSQSSLDKDELIALAAGLGY